MAGVKNHVSEAEVASPRDVIDLCQRKGVQIVDLRFCDLPGTWQHFSIPTDELSEVLFEEGIGFDGSSIRGFQAIHESDMLLIPDPHPRFTLPSRTPLRAFPLECVMPR